MKVFKQNIQTIYSTYDNWLTTVTSLLHNAWPSNHSLSQEVTNY